MVGSIKRVRPVGTKVLVELLTSQEAMGTGIIVAENAKCPVHQAYVIDLGPQVPNDYGISVGSRIWIDGAITFAPEFGNSKRKCGTIEFHMVKGVIEEEEMSAS